MWVRPICKDTVHDIWYGKENVLPGSINHGTQCLMALKTPGEHCLRRCGDGATVELLHCTACGLSIQFTWLGLVFKVNFITATRLEFHNTYLYMRHGKLGRNMSTFLHHPHAPNLQADTLHALANLAFFQNNLKAAFKDEIVLHWCTINEIPITNHWWWCHRRLA